MPLDNAIFILLAFFLSVIFSMGGAGAGVALIPIFNMMGMEFDMAKAIGLFSGASTTITSTIMNLKRKVLDLKFTLPIASMMLLFAPLGAYLNQFINQSFVKFGFMLMLFYSASMMMFGKKKQYLKVEGYWVLWVVGGVVGFIAGVLGVGGGNILIPLLALLGFEPKKVAVAVSFVVPFSTLSSFATYATYVQIDWWLLFFVSIASIVGGYIGNYLMTFKLNSTQIKKLMAFILYGLALKLLVGFL